MANLDWVSIIIFAICSAELAIQIVISDLSYRVKGAILLQPNKKLQTLSLLSFWRKLLGKWWVIATPFIFLIRVWQFIADLLACPWCSAYHISWLTSYLYLQQDIITSLLLAPLALVFVTILDRLHTHE